MWGRLGTPCVADHRGESRRDFRRRARCIARGFRLPADAGETRLPMGYVLGCTNA